MPDVQNPLSCSINLEDKKRLEKRVNHYKVPLIEGGLYGELPFCWPLSPAAKTFDSEGWLLHYASFTRTATSDFHIGWIAAGRFNADLTRLKSVSSLAESRLLSETLGHVLASGGTTTICAHYVAAMRHKVIRHAA